MTPRDRFAELRAEVEQVQSSSAPPTARARRLDELANEINILRRTGPGHPETGLNSLGSISAKAEIDALAPLPQDEQERGHMFFRRHSRIFTESLSPT